MVQKIKFSILRYVICARPIFIIYDTSLIQSINIVYYYIVKDGTTHIVWARGKDPLYRITGLNISTASPQDWGMTRVQLLKNTFETTIFPNEVQQLEIRAKNVEVPGVETTYWCHVHRLPQEMVVKHHVLQYESAIQPGNEGLVHHMEVFHCVAPVDEEIPLYVGPCFAEDRPQPTMVCKRVLAAWAMGAAAFTYPDVSLIFKYFIPNCLLS